MSQFNTYGSGVPSGIPQPAGTVENYLDTLNNTQWYNTGNGFQPETGMIARANDLGVTTTGTVLTVTAPVSGLYQIFNFAAQATSTNGTLPALAVAYTDLDTGATVGPTVILNTAATTGQGQFSSSVATINAKVGTAITVTISTAPVTLTANVKVRVASLG